MSQRVADKRVFITAAAHGIGRASALALAREGAMVWATDIDAESLGKLLDEIFGDLPAKPELKAIAETAPVKGGVEKIVELELTDSERAAFNKSVDAVKELVAAMAKFADA